MPRTRTYTPDFLNDLRQKLETAPVPAKDLSTRQSIDLLKDDLLAKRKAGWTWKAMAGWLTEQGLVIDASGLSTYVQDGCGTKTGKREKTKSTRAATMAKPIKKVPGTKNASPAGTAAEKTSTATRLARKPTANKEQKQFGFVDADKSLQG
jgi:hypothetical protein